MFIKKQGADADAAYERIAIIRRHMKEMQAEINATNTVDVAGEHAKHYEEMFAKMQAAALINASLDDVENGATPVSGTEFFGTLRAKYGK